MSFAAMRYQSTQISTESPVGLVVSMYDGALRFLREGVAHQRGGRPGPRGASFSRAHAVITELRATLDHERAPELSAQLDGLYGFVLDCIGEATRSGDVERVEPAIAVLETVSDAWRQLARRSS
jgi:flagellar protein FliS